MLNTTRAIYGRMTSKKKKLSTTTKFETAGQHFWHQKITLRCCLLAHVIRPWQKVTWLWCDWCLPRVLVACFVKKNSSHFWETQPNLNLSLPHLHVRRFVVPYSSVLLYKCFKLNYLTFRQNLSLQRQFVQLQINQAASISSSPPWVRVVTESTSSSFATTPTVT